MSHGPMTDPAASAAASELDGELKLLAQTCAALFGDQRDRADGALGPAALG